jgi:hypothetical protein
MKIGVLLFATKIGALLPTIEVWLRYDLETHFRALISILDHSQQVWMHIVNYLVDYNDYSHNGCDNNDGYYGNYVYAACKLFINNKSKYITNTYFNKNYYHGKCTFNTRTFYCVLGYFSLNFIRVSLSCRWYIWNKNLVWQLLCMAPLALVVMINSGRTVQ